jgi:hypothetical protein
MFVPFHKCAQPCTAARHWEQIYPTEIGHELCLIYVDYNERFFLKLGATLSGQMCHNNIFCSPKLETTYHQIPAGLIN